MAASDRDLIQVAFLLRGVFKKASLRSENREGFRFYNLGGRCNEPLQHSNETLYNWIEGGVMKKETSK